jgi:O-antigen ligase
MQIRSEKALVIGLSLYAVLTLGSQATMSIGIAVLLVSALIGFGGIKALGSSVRNAGLNPLFSRYILSVHVLAIACFLSLLFASWFPIEVGGMKPEVEWMKDLWKLWYFYWPLITVPCLLALGEESRAKVFRVYLYAFGIVSLIGCFQYFTGWPRPQEIPGTNRFHVTVFPGHHLSFASIAIFPFFLALSEIFDRKWLSRPWALAITVLGALAIFGTYSRQVWISLPIGIVVFFLIRLPKKQAIAMTVAGVLAVIGLLQVPAIRDRATVGMGIQERVQLWKINTEFFKLRPITGVGWRHNHPLAHGYFKEHLPEVTSPFVGHAHSNFFDFLGGLGLIGVLAYLFWTVSVLRLAFGAGAGFFAVWVVFHLNGLTQVNLWESKVIHSMMWSLAMILTIRILREAKR